MVQSTHADSHRVQPVEDSRGRQDPRAFRSGAKSVTSPDRSRRKWRWCATSEYYDVTISTTTPTGHRSFVLGRGMPPALPTKVEVNSVTTRAAAHLSVAALVAGLFAGQVIGQGRSDLAQGA